MLIASSCLSYPNDGELPKWPLREDEATTNRHQDRASDATLLSTKVSSLNAP